MFTRPRNPARLVPDHPYERPEAPVNDEDGCPKGQSYIYAKDQRKSGEGPCGQNPIKARDEEIARRSQNGNGAEE